ncbi:MAG: hypothetical protein V4627_00735 [Pseudomonadota bacterium]
MSWIRSSLVTGVQNIFNGRSDAHESRMQSALEDIREAMLDGLSDPGAATASKLELKVTYATDLNDLWYLRGDVMAAIAAVDGEIAARRKLDQISGMFKGLLPKSLTARNSSLRA